MTAITFETATTRPALSRSGHGLLVSLSRPWPETSLLAFLRRWSDQPRVYWEGGPRAGETSLGAEGGAVGFAGCGVAAALSADGPQRFQRMAEQATRLFDRAVVSAEDAPPVVGPRLFGGFAFRAHRSDAGTWAAFPTAYFVLPRYQLTRVGRWAWLTVNRLLEPGADPQRALQALEDEMRLLETIATGRNGHASPVSPSLCSSVIAGRAQSAPAGSGDPVAKQRMVRPRSPQAWQSAANDFDLPAAHSPSPEPEDLVDAEAWQRGVVGAVERIRRGELDKVVLAQACRIRTAQPVDAPAVLERLAARYPDCYRFLIEPMPGHAFYGATPELLAEVRGTIVRTVALAGSIHRGRSPEEDAALGARLLHSSKDRHEHALVVEAIQEHLLPLVTRLYVPGQPGLLRLSNIQHLQTVIRGELGQACGVLPVVEALHPTPAVGGTPRDAALRLIDETEPFSRGWYAAPVGWIDSRGNGLFAVALRSALSVGNETWLYAGAGIVADSDPEREWKEVRLKFRPVLEALEAVVSIQYSVSSIQ